MKAKAIIGILTTSLLTLLLIGEGVTQGVAGIGKAAHVNVAIFYVYNGNYTPPDTLEGMDIISKMQGNAQFLNIVHTTGIKDGDVLMMQADVLRESKNNEEDFGIDCQLMLHIKDEDKVTIQGLCQTFFFDVANNKEVKVKTIVKPNLLDSHGWNLIGYDAKNRVAIYADEEVGIN